MEDEQRRNQLLEELQKYIPFLESMIVNLENASTTQEKPRSAQLDKMKSLLALLTNKNKKMKIGTLQKCEDVLRKLHEKMEMSGSSKLQIVSKTKQTDLILENVKNASHSPLNTILTKLNIKNSSAPASPSPPPFQTNASTPIIIPTERLIDTGIVTSKLQNLPCYKSPSIDQGYLNERSSMGDTADLLYTRRQRAQSNQNSSSDNALFRRRSNSPRNQLENDSQLFKSETEHCSNEWEDLSDEESEVLRNRRIRYNTPEPIRRSVFDRLGQKICPKQELNSNSHNNFAVNVPNTPIDKIPRSAALITNITNKIKEAQIKQDIESDIAVYLSESEKAKSIKDKISQNPESANTSCGIKKSTPSIKAVPVRKLQDISIFGNILSNIDKQLIDELSKIPIRKSTESKQKKDVDHCKVNLKSKNAEHLESFCNKDPTKGSSYISPKTKDISAERDFYNTEKNTASQEPKIVKSDLAKEASSLTAQIPEIPLPSIKINQENSISNIPFTCIKKDDSMKTKLISKNGTSHTRLNCERLSDKYPRKKSTDSNLTDNSGKINCIAHKNDFKRTSPVQANIESKVSDKEKSKVINIPDVKSNDPRIRRNKSPKREGSFCKGYNGEKLSENDLLISEHNSLSHKFTFPSVIDMDYRYISNTNMPNMAPYQQPNTFSSNSNFTSHLSNNQEFIEKNTNKKPLLPTPNFGFNTFSDSNNYVNSALDDRYSSNSFIDNGRSDFFNEYHNNKISSNPYNYVSIDPYDKANSNDPNTTEPYKNCEFNYPPLYQTNSLRPTNYRGRGGGSDFKNSYGRGAYACNAYRKDSFRNFDHRPNHRPGQVNWNKEETLPNNSKINLNSVTPKTSARDEDFKSVSKTPDSERDLRSSSKERSDLRRSHKHHDTSSSADIREARSAIKSYKIPKIKRDSPQCLDNQAKATPITDKTTEIRTTEKKIAIQYDDKNENIEAKIKPFKKNKEQNSAEIEVQKTSVQRPCEETSQTNGDRSNKSDEVVNNEEKALMAKLFDILTKVCDKRTTPNDDHLNVLQKLRETIDPKKFEKIQKILDADSDPEREGSEVIEAESPIVKKNKRRIKVIESDSSDDDTSNEAKRKLEIPTPAVSGAPIKKLKRRNALEMLQHDVRDMFISEGVLTATGRRMCRVLKEDGAGANALNKDEAKTNVVNSLSRKCRGTKQIDYSEETDLNSSIDEDTSKDNSSLNENMVPRILLHKLNNADVTKVQNATRGRNTARRGRILRPFSRKITNTAHIMQDGAENSMQLEQEMTEESAVSSTADKSTKKHKNVCLVKARKTTNIIAQSDIAELGDNSNHILESITENSASKIVNVTSRNYTPKIKKKLKRKSGWKMGKLRGKKKIRKAINEAATGLPVESDLANVPINSNILNTDKDYFVHDTEKYHCKLCLFAGKLITGHYVHNHPTKEVYVSRLNPEEAKAAVGDSKCDKEIISKSDLFHNKCRFCNMVLYNENQSVLVEHSSLHTGEYRYMCNLCNHKSPKLDSLKHHFKYRHKKSSVKLSPQILYDLLNFPDCAYGYLCNHCNYTQILETNVEQHSKVNHCGLETDIIKIPLYSFVKTYQKPFDLKTVEADVAFDQNNTQNDNNHNHTNTDGVNISQAISDAIKDVLESDTNNKVPASCATDDYKDMKCDNHSMQKIGDKRPFLPVSDNQFSKIELVNSNELISNVKSSFEPFTKKMTITGALQIKINSLVERKSAECIPMKLEPISEPQVDIANNKSSISTLTTQERNIKIEKVSCIALEKSCFQPVSPNTNSEEASETCNYEFNVWDELDSNDSEHSNPPTVIENVSEVLQNIEKNGKGSGNMSNTIHRLASSLIKSPIKSNNANVFNEGLSHNETVNVLDDFGANFNMREQSIYNFETSLPPSEPIILNKELIKNTKMQIGTIRASLTDNKIIYGCCEKGCVYLSENESSFSEHIKNCHESSRWNGICNICDKSIALADEPFQDSYSMTICFQHIVTVHKSDILQKNDMLEPKKFLKMRRLSGDTLSINKPEPEGPIENAPHTDSQPFLKIESVVSLNADFLSGIAPQQNMQSLLISTGNTLQNSNSSVYPDLTKLISIANKQKDENEKHYKTKQLNESKEEPPIVNAIDGDVKLWLNNSNIISKNVSSYTPRMLLDLYKCMSRYCTYTSDDKVLFQNHLMTHTLEEGTSDSPNVKVDYLECSYCDKTCTSIISLIGHIKNNHSCCLYQCRQCFYRCFCKIYINLHVDHNHKHFDRPCVISLEISPADIRRWKLSSTGSNCNVLPYQCKHRGCKLLTMCKHEYSAHLQSHNLTSWTCFICNLSVTNIPDLILHLKAHEINIYQCCYCVYGCDTKQIMLEHLTSLHSEMPASTFMRNSTLLSPSEPIFELLKFNLETNKLATNIVIINDINTWENKEMRNQEKNKLFVEENKYESKKIADIDNKFYDSDSDTLIIDEVFSPDTNTEISKQMCSDVNEKKRNSHEFISHDKQTSIAKGERNLISKCQLELNKQNDILYTIPSTEVICAEDLSSESTKLSNEQVIENEDPLCIDQVSFNDHVNASVNEKLIGENGTVVNDSFHLVDIISNSTDGSTRYIENQSGNNIQKVTLPELKEPACGDINQFRNISAGNSDINIIKESIKHTGIDCGNLFKCIQCKIVFQFSCDFKEHIAICVKNESIFNCMYCSKTFKYVNSFIEHVKIHGVHRYGCGVCKYRSARPAEVKLHMIHKHKISNIEVIPLQPECAHPDVDLFICKEKIADVQTSIKKMDEPSRMKMNSFAPSDIDKLPRNSIYSKEVECGLCSFKTKVRSNIIRHLQQHKSEQSVSELCPVNPVPCLSSNERHFDKMTNLACSSHMNKTDSEKPSKLSAIPKVEDSLLPKYIIESQRFVCGISGCTYLTVNEEMLRHHYLALHINETCYMCPHCPNENKQYSGTINIEKIVSHLKLHDSRLYKCSYCNYHKSQRYIVERHIADKHPVSVNQVIVIREDSNLPSKVVKKELKAKAWVCGLCDFRAYDRVEIVKHAGEKHGMKSQYKCGLCQYRCSYKNSFTNHFAARHQSQPVNIVPVYRKIESYPMSEDKEVVVEQANAIDTTPLWSREHSGQRYIRGILLEEDISEPEPEKSTGKSKKASNDNKPTAKTVTPSKNAFENSTRRKRRNTVNYREHFEDDNRDKVYENTTKKHKRQSSNELAFNKSGEDILHLETNENIQSSIRSENMNHKKNNQECTLFYTTIYKTEATTSSQTQKTNDDVICLSSSDEDEIFSKSMPKKKSVEAVMPQLDEGNYGTPKDGKYVCPFCEEFCSESESEMYGHLCNELQYLKYNCSICKRVSWESTLLKAECDKTHPNIIGHVKELSRDTSIENWITRALEHQRDILDGITKVESDNTQIDLQTIDDNLTDDSNLKKSDKLEIPLSGEIYVCDLCPYSTKAIGFYERHKKKHMTKIYSCGHCTFGSQGVLKKQVENHIKKIHPGMKLLIIENTSMEKDVPNISDTSRYDLSSIDFHSKEEDCDKSNVVFICHYCPKRGSSIEDIKAHWEITHKVPKVSIDGKVKKGSFGFKYKMTTEQQLIKKGAKLIPKNLYVCQYCGKKGYLKVLQTHHKNAHEHMEMKLEQCMGKPPAIKCNLCSFIVYSESFMRKHFSLSHDGVAMSCTRITDEEISPNSSIEERPKYQCTYCTNTFDNLAEMSHHHEILHSHKSMVLKKVNIRENNDYVSQRQLFKCPSCPSAFESYNYICQHIETHVKPYICNYCPDGFSLPDTVKLHIKRVHPLGDINHYSIIANTQEILEATIAKVQVIIDDSAIKSHSEVKKKRLFVDEDDNKPCKFPKNEYPLKGSLKTGQLTVRAVAKKSTTKLPGKRQFAKKSTSRQSVNIVYSVNRNNVIHDLPISHYNKDIKYNNSNIHTVISLGGKPMRVHLENLEAITNIYPNLVLVDLKHQNQNLPHEFI